MDFHQLLAKMQELDRPAVEQSTEGCGMPPMPPASMPPASMPPKPEVPPPSMSVNLNAQGLENIEDMMRLFHKVNPDMMPKIEPMPMLSPPPSIMSIKPQMPLLKMLPDFDADNDDKIGGEKEPLSMMDLDKDDGDLKGSMMKTDLDKDDDAPQPGKLGQSLDRDNDGDHDMDDHDIEPKDNDDEEDKKKEAWDNEPNPEEKNVDYMVNKLSGGMNKSHRTYPKVADGDNPMQKVSRMESGDLRAQIRDELRKRLAEAKGAK